MAIHIKNINGHQYAYDVKTVWDKEKKKYKKLTKYCGVIIDAETKTFERRRNPKILEEKLILDYGDTYLLSETIKNSELFPVISSVLPKEQDTLMALLMFRMTAQLAFSYAEIWYRGNYASVLFADASIASQRISEFLKRLGDERVWRDFFEKYLATVTDEKKQDVIIDSTALPNQIDIPLSQFGHHGSDTEKQIRMIMVVDQKTGTPLYFRYVAGNIVDVSTLETTILELKKMGVSAAFSLLDAGYYGEINIKALYNAKIDFLTRLPAGRVLYREMIIKTADTLEKSANLVIYDGHSYFIQREEVGLFGNVGYVYLICDVRRKSDEADKYLIAAREDKINDDGIDENLKFKGKFALVSNKAMDPAEAIALYRTRQGVERVFRVSKSDLDIVPLNRHSEATLRGLLLLNFIALSVFVKLQGKLGGKYTLDEALFEGRNLRCKVFDDGLVISEPNKRFKDICGKLNVTVPKNAGM